MAPPPHAHDISIAALIPELDQLAADVMADWKVPGVALAVVRNGETDFFRAYGQRNIEANLPVTADTQFVIGSITKSFTATAMALLHSEGSLDWRKPVRDYLPEFRLHDPVATERVTVLDLLCHQTGLPRHDWLLLAGDRSADELLGPMRHLELSRDIRAVWQYNNLCYNVAGLLIERLSGQSYVAFLRDRLTDRLGMKISVTLDDLEASPDAAKPYHIHEDRLLPAQRLPIRTIAAGAINMSVTEMARWMRLHLGKGMFEGEPLLPASLVGELHVPRAYVSAADRAEFGDWHYGLGFLCGSYRGDRTVLHGGGWQGWSTLMTLVPAFGIGVAVFTNRSPNEVPAALSWYIIDRLRGREPVDWRSRFRQQVEGVLASVPENKAAREAARYKNTAPAHELADYAGAYEHPAYGVMSVKMQDGALHWSWGGMFADMTHRHYETFALPELAERLVPPNLAITFLTDRDGEIVSLSAQLEPMVKDIVFLRKASGDCINAGFRARCVGRFKGGSIAYNVTLDGESQLVLKPDHQPAHSLVPQGGRKFRIALLEGFFVEFRGDGDVPDTVAFYLPHGIFIAKREAGLESVSIIAPNIGEPDK
jgi:CubicO group peptidase (beta-lactamase class C family)